MSKGKVIDLSNKQLDLVKQIIKEYIPNKPVWAYGSRVTWKADEKSDLDLVAFDCNSTEIYNLKEVFGESSLPMLVDVMNWENIPENFKKNIKKKYVVLQEKTELPGWPEVKLGDIMKIFTGRKDVHQTKQDGKYNFFSCSPEQFFSDEYICDDDALIITGNGSYTGTVRFFSGKFDLYQRTYACILNEHSKEKYESKFIYYFAKAFFEKIYMGGTRGSSIPYIVRGDIENFDMLSPSLPEQKAIAEILSSLDDKIDLLHRQNKTLEDMAQTLFRQWFVEEADEGWAEKPLGETVDISIGRTPPRKEFQWFSKKQGDWKWISIKDMAANGTYIFDTSEYLTEEAVDKFNIPVIPSNTVILSFKMTIGRVCITTENMLSNEAIASFKFRSDTPYNKAYLYFYLKTFRFESLGSTSSIVTSINTEMIKSFIIPIPDAKLIEKFENTSTPLFSQIRLNQIQVTTLKNLRDTLLPKLISGDIMVN